MISMLLAYAGLFLVSLAAGSILPMQSEAALAGLLLATDYSPTILVLVATTGNVAGSTINWFLGRGIERFRDRSWFPVSPPMLERASAWYLKYGRWSLLLSWVPLLGDPVTIVAGLLRERFIPFLILVTIAKLARFIVVAALTLGLSG